MLQPLHTNHDCLNDIVCSFSKTGNCTKASAFTHGDSLLHIPPSQAPFGLGYQPPKTSNCTSEGCFWNMREVQYQAQTKSGFTGVERVYEYDNVDRIGMMHV